MIHTIYKVTNLVNNKFYVGKHSTNNLLDGYLGSGTAITKAIRKYGKSNFRKETLVICETFEEMNYLESSLITQEWLDKNKSRTYNMMRGGEGIDSLRSKELNLTGGGKKHAELLKSDKEYRQRWIVNNSASHIGQVSPQKGKFGSNSPIYGAKNGRYGKRRYIGITNGSIKKYILISEPIPDGYRKGWI